MTDLEQKKNAKEFAELMKMYQKLVGGGKQ